MTTNRNRQALESCVNLAEEAIRQREASDDPADHELLDAYRADVETARAALERTAPKPVALAAGPVGAAHVAHVMAAHVGESVVTGARRDRPYMLGGLDSGEGEESQGDIRPYALGGYNPTEGEGEDTRGPSKAAPRSHAGRHGKAAQRVRESDATKAARMSRASKRTRKS